MVLTDGLPPFLGIELRGDLGRADKVAKQHRQMPSLALWNVEGFSLHANRRGALERGGALRAKPRLGNVIGSAFWAQLAERCRTLVAKSRACSVIGSAF